jgi:hypothetical protein
MVRTLVLMFLIQDFNTPLILLTHSDKVSSFPFSRLVHRLAYSLTAFMMDTKFCLQLKDRGSLNLGLAFIGESPLLVFKGDVQS